MSEVLRLQNINKTYQAKNGEIEALKDINFSVNTGEFVSIIGPSGCGKSTLLSIIAGLEKKSSGKIYIDGIENENISPKIGYMLQKDSLLEWRTIYNNVIFGLEITHRKTKENEEYVKNLLNSVERLRIIPDIFYDKMEYYVTLDLPREELFTWLKQHPLLKYIDLTEVIDLMNVAMDNMPSATFKGATKKEYLQKLAKDEYDKSYENNYKKVKNSKKINIYRELKENIYNIINSCLKYALYHQMEDKFYRILQKNDFPFNALESNVLAILLVFHKVNKEMTLFERYIEENNIHALHSQYPLFSAIKDTYIESLFEIKNLDAKNSNVTIEDVYSKKQYLVTDIALSSASKNNIGNYIYSSLVTIKNFTFFVEYAFIYNKESHSNILTEIDNRMNKLKNIANETTKRFLACYLLFIEQDNMNIEYKELD